jgi:hypothetical protein
VSAPKAQGRATGAKAVSAKPKATIAQLHANVKSTWAKVPDTNINGALSASTRADYNSAKKALHTALRKPGW